eukprot:45908-Eustigmatos_ZCMA.PRE.1
MAALPSRVGRVVEGSAGLDSLSCTPRSVSALQHSMHKKVIILLVHGIAALRCYLTLAPTFPHATVPAGDGQW